MAPAAQEIIALAQGIPALSADQLRRITDVVAFMTDADLSTLKKMLLELQSANADAMKKELSVRQEVASKYHQYQTDKARDLRQEKEAGQMAKDNATADSLIQKI